MRILIGVDGSAKSLDAVRFVGRLVDPAVDELAVFFSPVELERQLAGRSRETIEGAMAGLLDEACALLPAGCARAPQRLDSALPAAVGLLDAAARWKADLLAVGARGHGSIQSFLLGSVSRAVVHGAHLPVLVVRRPAPEGRGLRVLVCHHPASASAVSATVGRLTWPRDTDGRVIGVAEALLAAPLPPWLERRVRDPDTAAIAKAWEKEHDAEVHALGAALEAFKAGLPPCFRAHAALVAQGNPGDKILDRARADDTDLVVLGRTPSDAVTRWLLGSTSEAVLAHGQANVLIVPVEKKPA